MGRNIALSTASAQAFENAISFMDDNGGYPFMLLCASIVVVVAACVDCAEGSCNQDGEALAVAIGVVSLLASALYLFHLRHKGIRPENILNATAFFFVLWAVLAGYGTFKGPWVTPGNGYFATWFGFFAATGMLLKNFATARSLSDRFLSQGFPVCLILVSSLVVLVSASIQHSSNNVPTIIGMIAGGVSFVVIVVLILINCTDSSTTNNRFIGIFFLGWWIIMTLILTFSAFKRVGNGYFGCWIALLASYMLTKTTSAEQIQIQASHSNTF